MKTHTHLYFITGVAILIFISIAVANVPPPPANQDIGIYDTNYSDFTEPECRECHSSGVPDTHHLLVQEGYECLYCHVVSPGGGIEDPIRNCLVCHLASPHHGTDAAIARHCSECHGSFVDDYDDGHYIPDYDVSLVTPDPSYRIINETTGKKWGGCEACHEPDYTASPVIESNPNTHHSAVYEMTCGSNNNICHFDPIADIRKCEDCHGVESIHNIQYDYDNTNGQLGYGHIGHDWDCKGCHAWYDPDKGNTPPSDIFIPVITSLSKGSIEAGISTKIDIAGNNFIQDNTYSDVVLVNGEEETTLESDAISSSKIEVTIPSLDEGNCEIYLLKGDKKSKLMPFVVVPPVTIDSAIIEGSEVIITGSGFDEEPEEGFGEWLGVDIEHEGEVINSAVTSWSGTLIKLDCAGATDGDSVTVKALFGSESTKLGTNGLGSCGDVNGDTSINAGDYGLLKGYVLGAPVSINTWEADVNCDGKINAGDYGLLRGYMLGAPVTINCCN